MNVRAVFYQNPGGQMFQTVTELGKRIAATRYRNIFVTMIGSVRLKTMTGWLLPVLAAYPFLPTLEG